MSDAKNRIANRALAAKVMAVEDAVKFIPDRAKVAVSGFTKSGEPKVFLPALADYFARTSPKSRISLFSGASLSDKTEGPLAPFIQKRAPYMSSPVSRKLIQSGEMDFSDVHLSAFSRNFMYGFYGDIDFAVVEVSSIREDGSVILTSSVGNSPEALQKARKIILEVNTAVPDYTGFHDILLPTVFPRITWPLPLLHVGDRIGHPECHFDLSKVVAVVESNVPDYPVDYKLGTDIEDKIAANVIDFLSTCRSRYSWGEKLPPIQSGVGNVANAVIGGLYDSPFRDIEFWTEVFQDGMVRFLEDPDKFAAASATAVSFSEDGSEAFRKHFKTCKDRLILRPMWVSNSAELVTRLFVIAMNTPIEVDIYGHVNSTHVEGSKIVNGLGGSGDFLRNAYISIVHTPSVRKLKDGRTVSCIMPYVRHIDHTEHDIKCVITEHGVALNSDIRSPRRRAHEIIDQCAHPHFRPILKDYLKIAGEGDEPRPTDLAKLQGWWKEYESACREL